MITNARAEFHLREAETLRRLADDIETEAKERATRLRKSAAYHLAKAAVLSSSVTTCPET